VPVGGGLGRTFEAGRQSVDANLHNLQQHCSPGEPVLADPSSHSPVYKAPLAARVLVSLRKSVHWLVLTR
jgi:hypothetical protein